MSQVLWTQQHTAGKAPPFMQLTFSLLGSGGTNNKYLSDNGKYYQEE